MDAKFVVNATGVWSDDIQAFDDPEHPRTIRPAKGIHITVPWSKVRNDIAAIVPVPKDKRSIFVVPWGELTYIGTTDTDYAGPLDDPECTPEDIDYLLDAMNLVLTDPLTKDDIVGTWAGLRPLIAGGSVGEKTADLSRVHKVLTSPSGLMTVTGGKLTTYRRMASDTVDAIVATLGRGGKSVTKQLRLLGATASQGSAMARGSAPSDEHLPVALRQPAARDPRPRAGRSRAEGPARPRPAVPPLRGDLRGARRDGDDAGRRALAPHPRPAARPRRHLRPRQSPWRVLIAPELGWDAARIAAEVASFRAALGQRAHRTQGSRSTRSTNRSALDGLRRTHAADRARDRGRSRSPAGSTATPSRARTTRSCAGSATSCATVLVDAASRRRGEPGLVATHHGVVARGPDRGACAAAVARPVEHRARSPPCSRCATKRGSRSRPPRDAAGCAARACRCTAASMLDLTGLSGIVGVDAGVDGARRPAGHVRHLARGHAASRARRDARALAPVDRPLDRRRLARLPERGADEHALREDRGHGRRPRRRARRRARDRTPADGRAPRSART